jgi:hypothetical protein
LEAKDPPENTKRLKEALKKVRKRSPSRLYLLLRGLPFGGTGPQTGQYISP